MYNDLVKFQQRQDTINGYALLGGIIGFVLFLWLPLGFLASLAVLFSSIGLGTVLGLRRVNQM